MGNGLHLPELTEVVVYHASLESQSPSRLLHVWAPMNEEQFEDRGDSNRLRTCLAGNLLQLIKIMNDLVPVNCQCDLVHDKILKAPSLYTYL